MESEETGLARVEKALKKLNEILTDFNRSLPTDKDDHDCHTSPDDGCEACQKESEAYYRDKMWEDRNRHV